MRESANKKACGSSREIQHSAFPLGCENFLELNAHSIAFKRGGAPACDNENIAFHRQVGAMTPKILPDRALDSISRHGITDFAANRDS
jgi:hypothetical protein